SSCMTRCMASPNSGNITCKCWMKNAGNSSSRPLTCSRHLKSWSTLISAAKICCNDKKETTLLEGVRKIRQDCRRTAQRPSHSPQGASLPVPDVVAPLAREPRHCRRDASVRYVCQEPGERL